MEEAMVFAHKVKDECFALARSENPNASDAEIGIIAGKLARVKYNDYLQSKSIDASTNQIIYDEFEP